MIDCGTKKGSVEKVTTQQNPGEAASATPWVKPHLGVSKNRGTPKWMVKIMENPIKMDDLGGKNTTIFGSTSNFSTSTFNGEAKLIVLLRNPIGRAVSHHNHDLSKSGSPEWLLAATVQFLMKHLIEIEIMELLIFFL